MFTEIFAEPELEQLELPENAEEWRKVCEELGLECQLNLTSSTTSAGPPYMFSDPRTTKIVMILCPRVVKLSDYKQSTIPTDVLKEAAKCKSNGWYHELYVAYDNQSPDPFLLGRLNKEYTSEWHIIARWGNELLPWEELEVKAVARVRSRFVEALERTKMEIELKLKDPSQSLLTMLGDNVLPKIEFNLETRYAW